MWVGHNPGVYDTWDACQEQIKGFSSAVYKSFSGREEAEKAYKGASSEYIGKEEKKGRERMLSDSKHQPVIPSISVDAACSGNPGRLEYRGVETASGSELFREGPYIKGTQNIGEFLAIVHGLAYLKKNKLILPLYSDSLTAMKWVRDKRINTRLNRDPQTEKLFQVVDRALTWLKENAGVTSVLKWDTSSWGEIPADFGRK